ncbi:MAG: tRNA threonylcarbamoyladenosine dehydratase [Bacilli bacterium]|nr:tRNA threonylcarbamoyladenosine dehydratase [Bacilli bacterium]
MDDRILKILSKEDLDKIKNLKVLIVGVGGVGGYSLEALVRSGVSNITIIDKDIVDVTNLNRQIIALNNNIGNIKVEEAKNRCLSINKDININVINTFLNKDNLEAILKDLSVDYIIDACDTITTKIELIKYAKTNNINIITCLGTGNRLNPEDLTITTLDKTYNDPLGKVLRKELKDLKIKGKVTVCWSKELPIKIQDRTPGSMIFVPASAGLLISSYIIRKTINK